MSRSFVKIVEMQDQAANFDPDERAFQESKKIILKDARNFLLYLEKKINVLMERQPLAGDRLSARLNAQKKNELQAQYELTARFIWDIEQQKYEKNWEKKTKEKSQIYIKKIEENRFEKDKNDFEKIKEDVIKVAEEYMGLLEKEESELMGKLEKGKALKEKIRRNAEKQRLTFNLIQDLEFFDIENDFDGAIEDLQKICEKYEKNILQKSPYAVEENDAPLQRVLKKIASFFVKNDSAETLQKIHEKVETGKARFSKKN